MSIDDFYNASLLFERNIETIDANGIPTAGWGTIGTVNGWIKKLSADKAIRNSTESVRVTHEFHCEYIDATEKDRITSGGVTYNVQLVRDPDGSQHHTEGSLEVIA